MTEHFSLQSFKRSLPRGAINGFHFLGALTAVARYRYPARRLQVVGVTGTDGKTTTTQAIYSILVAAGLPTSLVNTIGAIVSQGNTNPIGLHVTTPNPFEIQHFLRQAVNEGSSHVVIEATSHGLDQHRVWGCNFRYGVVTNITHDHLDYHRTYERYLSAKARLLQSVEVAVLNRDDDSYPLLREHTRARVVTYGIRGDVDYRADAITPTESGSRFWVERLGQEITLPLHGSYNVLNALAALAVAHVMGVRPSTIARGLANLTPPPGRLERVNNERDFDIYIDFAHTPNALENLLTLLRQRTRRDLIVVFGCAGERDQAKRQPMGQIAARLSDRVVITAEDPRTESLEAIIATIAEGCQDVGAIEGRGYFRIPDRQAAISFAINQLAQPGDTVVFAGKAHEKSMCFGYVETPWNEFAAVRQALEQGPG